MINFLKDLFRIAWYDYFLDSKDLTPEMREFLSTMSERQFNNATDTFSVLFPRSITTKHQCIYRNTADLMRRVECP